MKNYFFNKFSNSRSKSAMKSGNNSRLFTVNCQEEVKASLFFKPDKVVMAEVSPKASHLLSKQTTEKTAKMKVNQLLKPYRAHLYAEILQAWPYRYGIATDKSGKVFILGKQGQSISEKTMPKSLKLLKQKCQAVNEAMILLNNNHMAFTEFKHHFNTKIRPIIQQARKEPDSKFLNAIKKVLASRDTFFSSFFKTKGEQVACKIEKMAANESLVDHSINM